MKLESEGSDTGCSGNAAYERTLCQASWALVISEAGLGAKKGQYDIVWLESVPHVWSNLCLLIFLLLPPRAP